jgi:hypothetical protein
MNETQNYTVHNTVEDEDVFTGNEAEFVHFMRQIAVENSDEDMSITCLSEAKDYLEVYCDNLELK